MTVDPRIAAVAARIRPLRDWVCVKPLDYQHPLGLYVAGVKLDKGVVVAVGPGRRMRRKVQFQKIPGQDAGSIWFEDGRETGAIRPMRVNVGDVVSYSMRNQRDLVLDGERFVFVAEQAIYGRHLNDDAGSGFLWQQSAGFDRHGHFVGA